MDNYISKMQDFMGERNKINDEYLQKYIKWDLESLQYKTEEMLKIDTKNLEILEKMQQTEEIDIYIETVKKCMGNSTNKLIGIARKLREITNDKYENLKRIDYLEFILTNQNKKSMIDNISI